jgi:Ca2+-binding EF-hand superfamily protein
MKLSSAVALISTSIGFICATSIALTQPANVPSVPATVYEQFNMMDSNGDGKVSPVEHANGAKKMFEVMDGNSDGKVTAGEMDAAQPRTPSGHVHTETFKSADKIAAIDTNKDGILTADEHAVGSRKMFVDLDSNSDGAVSAPEMRTGHERFGISKDSKHH